MLIKIGTRGSKLALVQTREVENLLKTKYPQLEFEEIIISTKGDKDKRPLSIKMYPVIRTQEKKYL